MLQNETRANLKKHSWLYYQNKANKSQSISRLKDQIRTAFSDLTLLASNLPDGIQKEFFNLTNIKSLLYAMERYHINGNRYQMRQSNLTIAEFLVVYGLDKIIDEYEQHEKYSPAISSLAIEHLQRTKLICRDIAHNIEFSQREYDFKKSKQEYLFSWKDVVNHSQRVYDFILEMIDSTQVYSTTLEFVNFEWSQVDKNTYEGKITDPPDDNAFLGDLLIRLIYETKASSTKRSLQITLSLINDIKLTEKLYVKEVGDDLLIYKNRTQN